MWYVYILKCKNSFFYTGVTQNLKKRFQEHRSGSGAFFTGQHKPDRIVYHEVFNSEELAKKREIQIKRWSRSKKQALIDGDFQRLRTLSISRD